MISLNYVKNGVTRENIFTPFLAYTESCTDAFSVDVPVVQNPNRERILLEYEISGVKTPEYEAFMESENKGFFEKIGDKIIELFKKFVDMIDNAIEKIKGYSFKSKDYTQKMEVLIKKHPELKDEIIMACNKGALDLNDMKSIKEMDAAFDEVMKMAKNSSVDANSLKGKMDAAIKKFKENDEKKWTIVKVAGATSATISAIVACRTLKSKIAEADKNLHETKTSIMRQQNEILNYIQEKEKQGTLTPEEKAKMQAILSGNTSRLAEITRSKANMDSFIGKLYGNVSDFLDKHHNEAVSREFKVAEERKGVLDDYKKYQDDKKAAADANNKPKSKPQGGNGGKGKGGK